MDERLRTNTLTEDQCCKTFFASSMGDINGLKVKTILVYPLYDAKILMSVANLIKHFTIVNYDARVVLN